MRGISIDAMDMAMLWGGAVMSAEDMGGTWVVTILALFASSSSLW